MPRRNNRHHTAALQTELKSFQDELATKWRDGSIPDDWNYLLSSAGVEPHKTRVTIRLDTEIVKWFRKLGPGYQSLMNKVLRIYLRSLATGEISTHYNYDKSIPLFFQYQEKDIELNQPELWALHQEINEIGMEAFAKKYGVTGVFDSGKD